MKKKLPGVFPGKVGKDIGNNKKVFYSNKEVEETNNVNIDTPIKYEKNINQKINEIFKSPNYIYKIDVELTLKDSKVTKRIVGKNKTHIITMENELIPITDIVDIKQK